MQDELISVIRQVRTRWRMKLALRGAVGVVGIGVLVLLAGAFSLEAERALTGMSHWDLDLHFAGYVA